MKTFLPILITFFIFITKASATDNDLHIEREGFTVTVIDFQDGDKIKLFEVETGDHVLSKTRGQIDLSQLPKGKYLLENNLGASVVVEKRETDIYIEEALGTDYIVEKDAISNRGNTDLEEDLSNLYSASQANKLHIDRKGDLITIIDFEEGDKIKLFEVIDRVHVLSKTSEEVDLTQLAEGKYILENNKGQSVIVEKFKNVEQDKFAVAYY